MDSGARPFERTLTPTSNRRMFGSIEMCAPIPRPKQTRPDIRPTVNAIRKSSHLPASFLKAQPIPFSHTVPPPAASWTTVPDSSFTMVSPHPDSPVMSADSYNLLIAPQLGWQQSYTPLLPPERPNSRSCLYMEGQSAPQAPHSLKTRQQIQLRSSHSMPALPASYSRLIPTPGPLTALSPDPFQRAAADPAIANTIESEHASNNARDGTSVAQSSTGRKKEHGAERPMPRQYSRALMLPPSPPKLPLRPVFRGRRDENATVSTSSFEWHADLPVPGNDIKMRRSDARAPPPRSNAQIDVELRRANTRMLSRFGGTQPIWRELELLHGSNIQGVVPSPRWTSQYDLSGPYSAKIGRATHDEAPAS